METIQLLRGGEADVPAMVLIGEAIARREMAQTAIQRSIGEALLNEALFNHPVHLARQAGAYALTEVA